MTNVCVEPEIHITYLVVHHEKFWWGGLLRISRSYAWNLVVKTSSTGENRHTWKWLFQILGSNRTRQPAPGEMKTGVDGSGLA